LHIPFGWATLYVLMYRLRNKMSLGEVFLTLKVHCINNIRCSFKFILKAGVAESVVNAPLSTDYELDQLLRCVVCVFILQSDAWYVHNRLFNAYFENKFK
jgi:hypothetical protein